MLIAILAALALGAAPDAPQPTVITKPSWLKIPSGDQVARVYPAGALRRHISGRAAIRCAVTAAGLLELCSVVAEEPPGEGFGPAALALAPTFRMKPQTMARPGQSPTPVGGAHVTIPIRFLAPGGGAPAPVIGSRLAGSASQPVKSIDRGDAGENDGNGITLLTRPVWAEAPSFADVASVWPRGRASGAGHVVLRCAFSTRTGAPGGCETAAEEPAGEGFAKAARALSRRFQLKVGPELVGERTVWGQIAFHFVDPRGGDFIARQIGQPNWIVAFDPVQAGAQFPTRARVAGLKSGRGVSRCIVAADGALGGCQPLSGNPEGMGFSEAAVKIASVMKMNPWTDEGGPVDGATVDLPIRFQLAPDAAPPKP